MFLRKSLKLPIILAIVMIVLLIVLTVSRINKPSLNKEVE